MSVQNTILPQQVQKPAGITYTAGGQDITLNNGIVRKYLVSGDPQNVTDQEVLMFIKLCQYQGLNPFLREAYLIKIGNSPATIVTGKAALEKRAARCENYGGFDAGVVVIDRNGGLEYRSGALVLAGEQLVGGWAEVYLKGFEKPVKAVVSLEEYIGRKQNGEVNKQWAGKPATMIRKVAKMQALREAFPDRLEGMYSAEEMGTNDELPTQPVNINPQPAEKKKDFEEPEELTFEQILNSEE